MSVILENYLNNKVRFILIMIKKVMLMLMLMITLISSSFAIDEILDTSEDRTYLGSSNFELSTTIDFPDKLVNSVLGEYKVAYNGLYGYFKYKIYYANGTSVWTGQEYFNELVYTYYNTSNPYPDEIVDKIEYWFALGNSAQSGREVWVRDRGISYDEITFTELDFSINSPIEDFQYTYDVESVEFDLMSNLNATCYYTYENNTILFTNTGEITHTSNFSLGTPINETLYYSIDFYCYDNNDANNNLTTQVNFSKQAEPLEFDIIIPQNNQVFNYNTQEIEFHMLTNYISVCEHLTTNATEFVNFGSTNSSEHLALFNVIETIYEYNTTFRCYAPYVNETKEINITFFIDENAPITMTTSTVDFTQANNIVEDTFIVVSTTTNGVTNIIVEHGFLLSLVLVFITFIVTTILLVSSPFKNMIK